MLIFASTRHCLDFSADRLVQNLSSTDQQDVSKAMQESDVLLKGLSKIGVDRTVINKSSSDQQHMSQGITQERREIGEWWSCSLVDSFMSALEKDAQQRGEQRRQNKIRADEWKAKGNDAFHQQLYDQAIDFYTQVAVSLP